MQTQNVPEEPSPPQPAAAFRFLVDVLETLILSAILFFAINLVSERVRVNGFSMEPTLHNDELVIVYKLAYKLGQPQYGDVIVFRFPDNPQQEYIKRVIGLPGDRVTITDGVVSVNGQPLDEPYLKAKPVSSGNYLVPANQLFVLGDNRNESSDSRRWGAVPMDYVIGKAVLVYWPISGLRGVPHANLLAVEQQ